MFFQPDGLKKVVEKDERTKHYEETHASNTNQADEDNKGSHVTPHKSSDDLEELAKDIDSCPTCSPKKTKPPATVCATIQEKSDKVPPCIIVDSNDFTSKNPDKTDTALESDQDMKKPYPGLNPLGEESSLSRDISQATSLETGHVSMLPHLGSAQNSDISDSWENLEEADVQIEVGEEKVGFTVGENEDFSGENISGSLDEDRESLYNKYRPVQYNTM